MTVADALMLALGLIAVGSGALVVTSSHLVRAGLYLVISLGAVAGLYLVMGAELVAWVQVLVYVGAVVVLLLFAVMLTRAPIGPSHDLNRSAAPAALIGAGVGFGLTVLLADAFHWTRYDLPPPGTAQRVGEQIFGGWVLPFEVLSILLLAALVGAVVLSRPDLGAREEVAAAATEAPPADSVDESAEVVARMERIAARQAAAQARVRAARAEEKAAEAAEARATAEAEQPADATPPADPRKDRARDVIFTAHQARPRVGEPDPEPPTPTTPAKPDVIDAESWLVEERPQIEGRPAPSDADDSGRSGGRREADGSGRPGGRREVAGSGRPGGHREVAGSGSSGGQREVEGSTGSPAAERREVRGRGDRPALPAKPAEPAADDEGTDG